MNILDRKIRSYLKRKIRFTAFAGLINLLILFSVVWLSSFAADVFLLFSEQTRWTILFINLGLSGYLVWKFLLKELIVLSGHYFKNNYLSVAHEIAGKFPQYADRVINIFQLSHLPGKGISEQLTRQAIEEFESEIEHTDFLNSVKLKEMVFGRFFMIIVVAAAVFLMTTLQGSLILSAKRLFNPNGKYFNIPAFEFIVHPGEINIIKGMPFEVTADYTGPDLQECYLVIDYEDEDIISEVKMKSSGNRYSLNLENLKKSGEYYLRGIPVLEAPWQNEVYSLKYKVNLKNPPAVYDLQVRIQPPEYTGLPEIYLDKNIGDIVAYCGSKILVSAFSDKPLLVSKILFTDSTAVTATIRENKIFAEFILQKQTGYTIQATDQENIQNQDPIEYSITQIRDFYPVVKITDPGTDIEATPDAIISLMIEATDDLGFSSMKLEYTILQNESTEENLKWKMIPIGVNRKEKHITKPFSWDLSLLPLGYEESLKYRISVWDNDIVSGPKKSESEIYYIHFPSLEEIFENFAREQETQIDDMEDLADESEQLKKDLEKINRELKREKELSWEKKHEIESALEKQKQLQEKLQKIEQELQSSIQKLEKKELFSPEILEKYRQLQELFREIASPELLQALEELQKALDQLNKKQVDQAMQKLQTNQEKFRESLERTFELFKKVQLEQELDRLVKLAENLTKLQEQISDSLSRNESGITKELQNEQQKITENLDFINKSIQNLLNEELMQKYSEANRNLQNADELSSKNSLQKQSGQLSQMMQSGQKTKAQKQSGEMQQSLENLKQQLQNAQNSMVSQDKDRLMAQMQRVTENLVVLSMKEEQIMQSTASASDLSNALAELATEQQKNYENLSRVIKEIIDISKETFFISPEMNKSLGGAYGAMRKTLVELSESNKGRAVQNQKEAMTSLNEAVMQMQGSMQNMANSNSSVGFEQFMEQMQKMSGQQGQLNEESLNFMQGQGNQGNLSAQQQSQVRRMAAQQQALKEAMEQLEQESGSRSDVLGDLGKIAQEMEKVVGDMEQLKIDRSTIERQQRILNKMLDAQKSVRERELSRKRKSESAKEYARRSPEKIQNTEDLDKSEIGRNLQEALNEGYTPDYEKLIREYFQKLNESEKN